MDVHELPSGTSVMVPKKMSRTDTFPYRMASGGGINLLNGYGEASLPVTRSSDSLSRFFRSYEMGASSRIPFTSAQWQELERQTLIYKCIMASVPVPHDLLLSVVKCVAKNPALNPNVFDLKLSKGVDHEPGRCRRTDGKKWRCSRNAAPDQKYCERHMHRGRPRSRKPVEDQTKVNISSINRLLATIKAPVSNFSLNQTFEFPTKPDSNYSKPSFKADEDSRYFHFTKAEAITDMCETHQWQRLDSKLPSVLIPYGNTFDLNFSGNEDANAQSIQNKSQNRNNFVDAWSEEITLNRSPVSSLSLSLQGTDDLNPIQMGLNVDNPESINGGNDSQSLSWLTQSFSCAGPLGEVFQCSNSSSPRDGGEDNSLSGINPMGEITDSSGANSPTVN